MEKKFYVYKHTRLDSGEVFYIGKGHGKRAWSPKNRNPHWNNIAKFGYSVELIKTNLTEEESFSLEIEMIRLHKSTLVNMTDGGEGRSNYKWTKEQIQKRTESVLGKPRANKGTKWSSDKKERLSKAMVGKKHKDSKKVIDELTGIIYNNAKEASIMLNLPWGSVYKMLKGSRLNKTTLRYLEK